MLDLQLVDGPVARCIIDIGKVNAFGRADIQELGHVFQTLGKAYPKIRIASIESHKVSPGGLPIFCAGADQKERVGWSPGQILEHLEFQRNVIHQMRLLPIHFICRVEGYALGLGAELCLAADTVIASSDAVFGFPEINWGIVPGAGGYAWAHGWAPRPEAAQFYIEKGEKFDVEHAQWLGLVDCIAEGNADFSCYEKYVVELMRNMTPEDYAERKKSYHEKINYKYLFAQEQAAYAKCISGNN